MSRDRLGVKAAAWTSEPVTEHISHFGMFVKAMLTCSWALCHVLGLCVAGPLPLTPGGSFQTGEQMLLTVFYQHVTKGEAGVFDVWKIKGRKKFSASKYKEGDYVKLNFEWNIMHRQLSHTPGADMAIVPWVTRKMNLSCEGRRGARDELRMRSKTIIGHWREKDRAFTCSWWRTV